MLRKFLTSGAVLVAVLATSGLTVSAALAAPMWQNLKGEEIKAPTAATAEGTIIIHHTGGLGEAELECKGTLVGTVGAGSADKVNEVFNSTKEKNLVLCRQLKGICLNSEETVHADNLPWTTTLAEESGAVWDKATAANSGPGWILLCSTFFGNVEILCALNGAKTKFTKNSPTGAEFGYQGSESGEASCSDGGKSTITGQGIVKEFLVS